MFAFTTSLPLSSYQKTHVGIVRASPRYTAVLRPGSRFRNFPSIPISINNAPSTPSLSTQQDGTSFALEITTPTPKPITKKPLILQVLSERITYIAALLKRNRLRHARALRYARFAVAGIFALIAVISLRNPGALATSAATSSTGAGVAIPSGLSRLPIPESLANTLRPFTESFGVVFLSEFGDKSMFATALMAMKHSPILVLIGALAALTVMTLIACFLGQMMHYLPATVTHYSSIALFVFFGAQMLLQARDLPATPGGRGGERADAETLVADMAVTNVTQSPLAILAKISSLIFVAEWCDRSMIATMALAASSNTLAVVGGATAANVVCTGFAVGAAALVASRISERTVAIVAGVLFEVFAVFTFIEGPES